MEYQFSKYGFPYLRTVTSGKQTREEVQEIRLPEAYPDIGRVLDCWGQVMIRSKEWRGDGIRVSGGVMVWVLYLPEEGAEVYSVEGWIPFQMRWDFSESSRDGSICVMPFLQSVDARSVSARKLMVRCSTCLAAEALEPSELELWQKDSIPEDVCLLTRTYPLEIAQESGEKLVQMEESLELPAMVSNSGKILRFEMNPLVLENKIMANRLVFRGMMRLHILFSDGDGSLFPWDTEIPFSQYTDLDKDYSSHASAMVIPMLTSGELERSENGQMAFLCSLAVQYIVFDRKELEFVEDAYCPGRSVSVQKNPVHVPVRLDAFRQCLTVEDTALTEGSKTGDISWCMESPESILLSNEADVTIGGQYKILYFDAEGKLQSKMCKASSQCRVASDSENRLIVHAAVSDSPRMELSADRISAKCDVTADLSVIADQQFQMVASVSLGEEIPPDPTRPSLILCRADGSGLWDIAKRHGSTVEAIMSANGLSNEPQPDQLLLIPIA